MTPQNIVVRPAEERDFAAVLRLNNSAVPHVNALSAEQFHWLVTHVDYFRVYDSDDGVLGFVFALSNGTEYWSANYAWFGERYDEFLYLDRIVVADGERRTGVGRALYADVRAIATGRWPRVTLEVNLRPPNPGSLRFHERMGFQEIGVRESDDGEKAVVMMELPLNNDSSAKR